MSALRQERAGHGVEPSLNFHALLLSLIDKDIDITRSKGN
jgi:hypothetical protein